MEQKHGANYRLLPKPGPEPLDRTLEMTLRYNYRRDLKEASKPSLYGLGIDFYEEDRIRAEQERGW